jgi:ABC-type uncharacterized transport system auxiliary subunit
MRLRSALVLLAVAICGCTSAPKISYYTLAMEPSGRVETDVNIVVERFHTTEALGRDQILVAVSPTEIDYYATDQWAGGVGQLVQRKLAEEFRPLVDGRRTMVVSGTVLSFEQVDGGSGTSARLKLQVVVRDAEKKRYEPPVFEKTYSITRPAPGPNPAGVVKELSRCVEDVAAEIAADVKHLP